MKVNYMNNKNEINYKKVNEVVSLSSKILYSNLSLYNSSDLVSVSVFLDFISFYYIL